jgi:hypothetical protein
MTQTEALRLALEALESAIPKYTSQRKDQKTLGGSLDYWKLSQHQRMKAITAIKAALANEALERKAENARELGLDYYVPCCTDKTCSKCKAALEAKDEIVALVVYRGEICYKSTDDDQSFAIWCPVNYDSKHEFADGTKFYTTPPQRKPLTDEEIDKAMAENKQTLIDATDNYWNMRRAYARIIEAAHGIKGEA